jgi:hypothetical protein
VLAAVLLALLAALVVAFTTRTSISTGETPTQASAAAVDFRGGWEEEGLGAWSQLQHRRGGQESDQLQLVTSPVGQGRYAARFIVRPGDRFRKTNGERTEVVWHESDESEGDDYFYAWSTFFPSGWVPPAGFGLIFQVHADNPYSPVLAVNASDELKLMLWSGNVRETSRGVRFEHQRQYTFLESIPKGRWIDLVLHVRYSRRPTGSIEVWHRAQGEAFTKGVDLERLETIQVDGKTGRAWSNYLKHGLYRKPDSKTNVLYHDGFTRGKSFGAVVRAAFGFRPKAKPLEVSSVTPRDGATVSGLVYWRANVGGAPVSRVEFLIDGRLRSTERHPPYEFNGSGNARWNTGRERVGLHRLTTRAVAADGRVVTSTIRVRVTR